jgi:hypothetical protein
MPFGASPLLFGSTSIWRGERIATAVLWIGPVFVPLESFYQTDGLQGRLRGMPIRRSASSVLLAYARWLVAPVLVFIVFLSFVINQPAGPPNLQPSQFATLGLLGMGWLLLVFGTGRTFGAESKKRGVLYATVGHAAPPELLHTGQLKVGLEAIHVKWRQLGAGALLPREEPVHDPDWQTTFPKDVATAALPLYYALCRYQAALDHDQMMRNRAQLAWTRLVVEASAS